VEKVRRHVIGGRGANVRFGIRVKKTVEELGRRIMGSLADLTGL
jgi:hypothetical protein